MESTCEVIDLLTATLCKENEHALFRAGIASAEVIEFPSAFSGHPAPVLIVRGFPPTPNEMRRLSMENHFPHRFTHVFPLDHNLNIRHKARCILRGFHSWYDYYENHWAHLFRGVLESVNANIYIRSVLQNAPIDQEVGIIWGHGGGNPKRVGGSTLGIDRVLIDAVLRHLAQCNLCLVIDTSCNKGLYMPDTQEHDPPYMGVLGVVELAPDNKPEVFVIGPGREDVYYPDGYRIN